MSQARSATPFLTDIKTLRARARENLGSGNVTSSYEGDVHKTIEILQTVLATELVCVLRYTMHAVTAAGISSDGVRAEFQEHADEEQAEPVRPEQRHDAPQRDARVGSGTQ